MTKMMRKVFAIALAGLVIGFALLACTHSSSSSSSMRSTSTVPFQADANDVRYVRELIADNVCVPDRDAMAERGRGIANYLSRYPNANAVAEVFQENEREGFIRRDVSLMIIVGMSAYAPQMAGSVDPLVRQYVGTHPEFPAPSHSETR